jgi:hypothetical protein
MFYCFRHTGKVVTRASDEMYTILFLPQKPLLTDGSLKQQVVISSVSQFFVMFLYVLEVYVVNNRPNFVLIRSFTQRTRIHHWTTFLTVFDIHIFDIHIFDIHIFDIFDI